MFLERHTLFLALLVIIAAHTDCQKPNVVILLADDLGIGDVGCYGNTTLATPNIDSLAQDGAKLTHFLTAGSLCTPSRAALLTGRYPIRSGMSGYRGKGLLMNTASPAGLPPSEITFAELLKEAGYNNALIGKWHQGLHRNLVGDNYHNPLNQGFDYWFGIPTSNVRDFDATESRMLFIAFPNIKLYTDVASLCGLMAVFALAKMGIGGIKFHIILALSLVLILRIPLLLGDLNLWNNMLYRNFDLVEQPIDFTRMSQRLVAEGVEFLEACHTGGTPCLLFMSFLQVHTMLHAGPDFRGKSNHGRYGDEVMELDWSVGQILKTLDRFHMRDNTFVVFMSDHGGHAHEYGRNGEVQAGYNGPLYRGSKTEGGMDGGIRSPALIRWPKRVKPGTKVGLPLSNMDILPTIAEIAGVPVPTDRIIDGVSLLYYITDQREPTSESEREYLMHYCEEKIFAMRFKPDDDGVTWKIRYATPKYILGGEGCAFTCHCKASNYIFHDVPLVFDITSDPGEKHPLPSDSPRAKSLVERAYKAVDDHKKSVKEVEIQIKWTNLLRPWLWPCCNFPYCSCRDTKKYAYRNESSKPM